MQGAIEANSATRLRRTVQGCSSGESLETYTNLTDSEIVSD